MTSPQAAHCLQSRPPQKKRKEEISPADECVTNSSETMYNKTEGQRLFFQDGFLSKFCFLNWKAGQELSMF